MTKHQLELLRKIISEHMDVIMQITCGSGDSGKKLSPELVKKLGLPKDVTDLITDSYKFGKLMKTSSKKLDGMPEKEVTKLINDLKLSPAQKRAIEYSQINTQVHLQSLQSKVTSTVLALAIQDQTNMYNTIGAVIPDAIANNTNRYKIIQQLRETSKDWNRDWHRVAMTEMQNAKMNGEAQAILSGDSPLSSKKGDTDVFKRPAPNCCAMCRKLYLEKGSNKPIVFKLSELLANGTNYGKKQAEWKAVVGTVHPSCICQLSILPEGYHFDDSGAMVPD
jgi:hypothetical protein